MKLILILAMCLTSTIFCVEGPQVGPLSAEEQAVRAEMQKLHQQLNEKREEFLKLLEQTHPKIAALLRQRLEEERKRHEKFVDGLKQRREQHRGPRQAE
jgi:hypothetical protein